MTPDKARYAIYFAPKEGSALAEFGRKWLGRNGANRTAVGDVFSHGLSREEHGELVKTPNHYGFHATLKAPFELAGKHSENELIRAFHIFAQDTQALSLGRLNVQQIGQFLALVPESMPSALRELHTHIVRFFESFRAPITDYDRERYGDNPKLGLKHRQYVEYFGYPHIFEYFRFHLTLTGNITEDHDRYKTLLQELYAPLAEEEQVLDNMALFYQPNRASHFTCMERAELRVRP